MGLQASWLAHAGLVGGQSVAGAYGPGAYVAGWALGAWLAARAGVGGRALAALGAAWTLGGNALAWALLAPDLPWATARVLLALALCAVGSGWFLTAAARALAARAPREGIGSLLASNLVGAMCGALALGLFATAQWGRDRALVLSLLLLLASFGLLPRLALATKPEAQRSTTDPLAFALVAGTTLCGLGLEWICARVAVMWIGSETAQLTLVVAVALLALAGGAVAARWLGTGARAVTACLCLCALGSLWPLHADRALALVREHGDLPMALVLVVPTLAPLGAVLPLLHARARGESGRRLGDLVRAEVIGALLAGPVLHAGLVASVGIKGTLAALCALAGLLAAVWSLRERDYLGAFGAALVGALLAVAAAQSPAPALSSPKLVDPALRVRFFREDEHFSVAVVDDGVLGERTLLTDQFRAAGNGPDYRYMQALGHLPVLLHPQPRRVAVLALGTGTTLGAVSLHDEVERIEVLEISSAVVEAAALFGELNRGALDRVTLERGDGSERVAVIVEDGRRTLALRPARYDVVTMEPLLPDSPFGVYLYTPEFYAVARAALAPGGILCQWIPPHALEPDSFVALLQAFSVSFPDARAWLFGTQVLLTGSALAPSVAPQRWSELDSELLATLRELGLGQREELAARHVAELSDWEQPARRLRDWDPWIAWRAKPEGSAVLAWLPANLERLEAHASSLAWGEPERERALAAVRESRRALGWGEFELRRGEIDAQAARARALAPLERLERSWRTDAEVRAVREEIEFLYGMRTGVAELARGNGRAALEALLGAAEARPLRADVHAYVAAALWASGKREAAQVAGERAVTLCPRLAQTPQGARALALGLPPELLGAR
ncbi:MAG: hypothetical protein FJ298_03035 [Planctomycetes bacterium]|nr:hypothetical protein [Planctomycetota bacterium]